MATIRSETVTQRGEIVQVLIAKLVVLRRGGGQGLIANSTLNASDDGVFS